MEEGRSGTTDGTRKALGSHPINFPEVTHLGEKKHALKFYQLNGVPEALETLLNTLYKANPDDVYGYMSDYFLGMSKEPVISSVMAMEGLDSSGRKSVQIDLSCTVCGTDKMLSSCTLSVDPFFIPPDPPLLKSGGKKSPKGALQHKTQVVYEPKTLQASFSCGDKVGPMETATKYICNALKGLPLLKFYAVDQALEDLRLEAEGNHIFLHPSALLAVSCAAAVAGSKLSSTPLFLYLTSVRIYLDFPESPWASAYSSKVDLSSRRASTSTGTKSVKDSITALSENKSLRNSLTSEGKKILSRPLVSSGTLDTRKFSSPFPVVNKGLKDVKSKNRTSSLVPTGSIDIKGKGSLAKYRSASFGSQKSKLISLSTDNTENNRHTVPFPIVAVLGKGVGSKLKMHEFCLTPLAGSTLPHRIRMLEKLYTELGRVLTSNFGPAALLTQPNGAYCPILDKPDQALVYIEEAATICGVHFDVDVGIFLDVRADTLYDEEKGKYELMAGVWKTTEEVIQMYSDLLQSHNGLLGFIDPLHPKDLAGWKKFKSKLGSKCLFVADRALEKGLPLVEFKKQEKIKRINLSTDEGSTLRETGVEHLEGTNGEELGGLQGLSCAGLTWENTLSSTMDKIDQLKGCSHYILMRAPSNLTVNTAIADLAVAAHCRFIRLGAPIGMNTLLLNRLLRIREELVSRKLHEPAKAHLFASDFEQ